jgi:5-methylcytosine-specific restriction endonuclease McrA
MTLTLGQQRYREYLKSEDWKEKREKKNPTRCGICAATENLDIHHIHYRNWTNVEMSDLRVLCRRCHDTYHFLEKAGKIKYTSQSHHSRWAILKHAVKKELGLTMANLFKNKGG